jgi:DNA-binding transcriptional MerR regulator
MVELPFLKKKKPEVIRGKGFVPVDRVKELSARGFSELEIIDTLRREGFSPKEIDDALTQVIRSAIASKEAPKPKEEEKLLPTLSEIEKEKKEVTPEIPETSLPEYYAYPSEDYIDAIIEARISEVREKISQIGAKYGELEKKIESISQKIAEVAERGSEEQRQILQKVESLKESLEELVTRTGAIEKAFKETLPALIESVRALSDLVQRIKSGV